MSKSNNSSKTMMTGSSTTTTTNTSSENSNGSSHATQAQEQEQQILHVVPTDDNDGNGNDDKDLDIYGDEHAESDDDDDDNGDDDDDKDNTSTINTTSSAGGATAAASGGGPIFRPPPPPPPSSQRMSSSGYENEDSSSDNSINSIGSSSTSTGDDEEDVQLQQQHLQHLHHHHHSMDVVEEEEEEELVEDYNSDDDDSSSYYTIGGLSTIMEESEGDLLNDSLSTTDENWTAAAANVHEDWGTGSLKQCWESDTQLLSSSKSSPPSLSGRQQQQQQHILSSSWSPSSPALSPRSLIRRNLVHQRWDAISPPPTTLGLSSKGDGSNSNNENSTTNSVSQQQNQQQQSKAQQAQQAQQQQQQQPIGGTILSIPKRILSSPISPHKKNIINDNNHIMIVDIPAIPKSPKSPTPTGGNNSLLSSPSSSNSQRRKLSSPRGSGSGSGRRSKSWSPKVPKRNHLENNNSSSGIDDTTTTTYTTNTINTTSTTTNNNNNNTKVSLFSYLTGEPVDIGSGGTDDDDEYTFISCTTEGNDTIQDLHSLVLAEEVEPPLVSELFDDDDEEEDKKTTTTTTDFGQQPPPPQPSSSSSSLDVTTEATPNTTKEKEDDNKDNDDGLISSSSSITNTTTTSSVSVSVSTSQVEEEKPVNSQDATPSTTSKSSSSSNPNPNANVPDIIKDTARSTGNILSSNCSIPTPLQTIPKNDNGTFSFDVSRRRVNYDLSRKSLQRALIKKTQKQQHQQQQHEHRQQQQQQQDDDNSNTTTKSSGSSNHPLPRPSGLTKRSLSWSSGDTVHQHPTTTTSTRSMDLDGGLRRKIRYNLSKKQFQEQFKRRHKKVKLCKQRNELSNVKELDGFQRKLNFELTRLQLQKSLSNPNLTMSSMGGRSGSSSSIGIDHHLEPPALLVEGRWSTNFVGACRRNSLGKSNSSPSILGSGSGSSGGGRSSGDRSQRLLPSAAAIAEATQLQPSNEAEFRMARETILDGGLRRRLAYDLSRRMLQRSLQQASRRDFTRGGDGEKMANTAAAVVSKRRSHNSSSSSKGGPPETSSNNKKNNKHRRRRVRKMDGGLQRKLGFELSRKMLQKSLSNRNLAESPSPELTSTNVNGNNSGNSDNAPAMPSRRSSMEMAVVSEEATIPTKEEQGKQRIERGRRRRSDYEKSRKLLQKSLSNRSLAGPETTSTVAHDILEMPSISAFPASPSTKEAVRKGRLERGRRRRKDYDKSRKQLQNSLSNRSLVGPETSLLNDSSNKPIRQQTSLEMIKEDTLNTTTSTIKYSVSLATKEEERLALLERGRRRPVDFINSRKMLQKSLSNRGLVGPETVPQISDASPEIPQRQRSLEALETIEEVLTSPTAKEEERLERLERGRRRRLDYETSRKALQKSLSNRSLVQGSHTSSTEGHGTSSSLLPSMGAILEEESTEEENQDVDTEPKNDDALEGFRNPSLLHAVEENNDASQLISQSGELLSSGRSDPSHQVITKVHTSTASLNNQNNGSVLSPNDRGRMKLQEGPIEVQMSELSSMSVAEVTPEQRDLEMKGLSVPVEETEEPKPGGEECGPKQEKGTEEEPSVREVTENQQFPSLGLPSLSPKPILRTKKASTDEQLDQSHPDENEPRRTVHFKLLESTRAVLEKTLSNRILIPTIPSTPLDHNEDDGDDDDDDDDDCFWPLENDTTSDRMLQRYGGLERELSFKKSREAIAETKAAQLQKSPPTMATSIRIGAHYGGLERELSFKKSREAIAETKAAQLQKSPPTMATSIRIGAHYGGLERELSFKKSREAIAETKEAQLQESPPTMATSIRIGAQFGGLERELSFKKSREAIARTKEAELQKSPPTKAKSIHTGEQYGGLERLRNYDMSCKLLSEAMRNLETRRRTLQEVEGTDTTNIDLPTHVERNLALSASYDRRRQRSNFDMARTIIDRKCTTRMKDYGNDGRAGLQLALNNKRQREEAARTRLRQVFANTFETSTSLSNTLDFHSQLLCSLSGGGGESGGMLPNTMDEKHLTSCSICRLVRTIGDHGSSSNNNQNTNGTTRSAASDVARKRLQNALLRRLQIAVEAAKQTSEIAIS